MDKARKEFAFSVFSHLFSQTDLYTPRKAGKSIPAKEKSSLDLVSDADMEIERIIMSEINLHFPEDGILSEESPELKGITKFRWIIDPLDGTHNFLAGFKEFGTILALEEDGIVIWGAFYLPMLEEFFVAERDIGAFCNGQRIRVSRATSFAGGMFCPDSIMRLKPREILRDIERFCALGLRLRAYGSCPYNMTRVALGQAIVALNRVGKPWDIAASALIVEEAGGTVTDENGKPWQIHSENLIATNGILHQRALELFR